MPEMMTTATTTPAATAVVFTPPPDFDSDEAASDEAGCVITTVLPGDVCVTTEGEATVAVAVPVDEGDESALPTFSFVPLK